MISKILFLPFRIVWFFVRVFVTPWYLRWVFRLPWVIYIGVAAWLGFLALQEFETYQAGKENARLQIAAGPPAPIALSEWGPNEFVPYSGEVNIEGLYFAALPTGSFIPTGLERSFVLLADDLGREVKAALVVRPSEIAQLQRQLAAQGSGDRIPVTVNGIYSRNVQWVDLIRAEMSSANVPSAQNLVIIEPFLGLRSVALHDSAEGAYGAVALFGGLATFAALIGIGKFLFGRKTAATQSQKSAKQVHAERKAKVPTQKALPSDANASPWGTSKSVDQNAVAAPKPAGPKTTMVQPQSPQAQRAAKQAIKQQKPAKDLTPAQPAFTSVFPGGGSSFRFKSADDIIRQSFGTLSTLNKVNRREE